MGFGSFFLFLFRKNLRIVSGLVRKKGEKKAEKWYHMIDSLYGTDDFDMS